MSNCRRKHVKNVLEAIFIILMFLTYPVSIHLFKASNKKYQNNVWNLFIVTNIANFEKNLHIVLVFSLMLWNK